MVARFGLQKTQNALKTGDFETIKGSKMCFSKNDPGAFGVPKQVKCAHFEPIVSHLGLSKVTKCLENGLFWDQKRWVKSFSTIFLRPFGVPKQMK